MTHPLPGQERAKEFRRLLGVARDALALVRSGLDTSAKVCDGCGCNRNENHEESMAAKDLDGALTRIEKVAGRFPDPQEKKS